ncbi:alpha/beta hydrolase [Chryseobacterium populi]|uniref:Alpha/beta superfamily hydrolase n=1 Tax=Chryseobacterium populi TaxID=1144316 RepID=J2KRX6_9FLAO|nr:alpha/beta hydrolase [Chryseobacterium populi]EJL75798.1 alpha/beta superfamily hydrolase [Chryseobacterium populi]
MYKYKIEKVSYLSEREKIAALQYTPEKEDKCPAIIMAHGFGLIKEAYIDRFAEKFAGMGFVVILFDYRNFGESEGLPRQEVNPFMQIDDYKNSITYAQTLNHVDDEKIGIWGTSYSGGHAIAVAATDRRVQCVVSQVPTISGFQSGIRRMPAEKTPVYLESIKKDRRNRFYGKEPIIRKLTGEADSLYPTPDAEEYYMGAVKFSKTFRNEVTLRSTEYSRMYEPGIYVSRISPVPILFIVALNDMVTPTDLCLKAYEEALHPKKLVSIPDGHFSPYTQHFDVASDAALHWFRKHLY